MDEYGGGVEGVGWCARGEWMHVIGGNAFFDLK